MDHGREAGRGPYLPQCPRVRDRHLELILQDLDRFQQDRAVHAEAVQRIQVQISR
ncbi:hypothetical protein ACFY05_33525 [Microtetraspora fusca]|uniref:Uncharacterized protein n=1 Tax=Microtetraspora fusca TaxID=1997 RepID=A0ABW6VJ13_MICFU